MVLLQIGLGLHVTNWILGCVSSASFVVLINGGSFNFFRSVRGLIKDARFLRCCSSWSWKGLSLLLKASTS
jgi:hypothetical protein